MAADERTQEDDVTRRRFLYGVAAARPGGRTRWPGKQWETGTPESAGFDPAPLEEMVQGLGGRGCVVKDGLAIRTWGDQREIGDWFSSAKPVLTTFLFFALNEGRIKSVDAPVRQFGWNLLPKDNGMTFRHLANMISGYARPEPPGEAWAYNDFAIQLYQKTLFDKVFAEPPEQAANHPRRFAFLGLEDGLQFRAANRRISASVRDFARIAWFWLNKGNWNGVQLLPERYFSRYVRPSVRPDLPNSKEGEANDYLQIGSYGGSSDQMRQLSPALYGFTWWFNVPDVRNTGGLPWPDAPRDTFASLGVRGNYAFVFPGMNALLVSASGNWGKFGPGDPVANRILRLFMQSARRKAS